MCGQQFSESLFAQGTKCKAKGVLARVCSAPAPTWEEAGAPLLAVMKRNVHFFVGEPTQKVKPVHRADELVRECGEV